MKNDERTTRQGGIYKDEDRRRKRIENMLDAERQVELRKSLETDQNVISSAQS